MPKALTVKEIGHFKLVKTNLLENMGPRRKKIVFHSGLPIYLLLLLESVLYFRRVTGMLDLGECQSLRGNNSPSAVYLSPVQTPPFSNNGYFMLVQFGIR